MRRGAIPSRSASRAVHNGTMTTARYDGHSDWYEHTFAAYGDLADKSSSSSLLARLLGPGDGCCLDVACGTGLHFAAIESTGRHVLGIDISSDQLRLARRRATTLVRADASRLPFADASFPTAVCTYLHTDTSNIESVFGEVARSLRTGGLFVYLGVHPCFRGHFVEHLQDRRVVHQGYWDVGWHTQSPHRTSAGVRERVGAHHATLSDLLNALLNSGLRLTRIEEGEQSQRFADRIAFTAVKD